MAFPESQSHDALCMLQSQPGPFVPFHILHLQYFGKAQPVVSNMQLHVVYNWLRLAKICNASISSRPVIEILSSADFVCVMQETPLYTIHAGRDGVHDLQWWPSSSSILGMATQGGTIEVKSTAYSIHKFHCSHINTLLFSAPL